MSYARRLALLLTTLTLLSACLHAAGPKQGSKKPAQKKPAIIEVYVDWFTGENGTEPMEKLLTALGEHPKNNLFRVRWNGGASTGTVIYDRKRETAKYWYVVRTPERVSKAEAMVTGVTPVIMGKMVSMRKDDGGTTGAALFDSLDSFGCKTKNRKHTEVSW